MKYRDEEVERIDVDASSRKVPSPDSFARRASVRDGKDRSKVQRSVDRDHTIASPVELAMVGPDDKYVSPF